ncbi:hypothetical protein [Dethiothermospora halolimnae]
MDLGKRVRELEKRVAELEGRVPEQPNKCTVVLDGKKINNIIHGS